MPQYPFISYQLGGNTIPVVDTPSVADSTVVETVAESFVTTITISAKDRSGLVMDVATVLNTLNAKVRSLNARGSGINLALVSVSLEVKDSAELRSIMSRLAKVPGVSSVVRNGT